MAKEVNYSSMRNPQTTRGIPITNFFTILQARDLKRLMESVKYVTEQKQTSYPIFGHVRSDGNKINDDDEKAIIWSSLGHASMYLIHHLKSRVLLIYDIQSEVCQKTFMDR